MKVYEYNLHLTNIMYDKTNGKKFDARTVIILIKFDYIVCYKVIRKIKKKF